MTNNPDKIDFVSILEVFDLRNQKFKIILHI